MQKRMIFFGILFVANGCVEKHGELVFSQELLEEESALGVTDDFRVGIQVGDTIDDTFGDTAWTIHMSKGSHRSGQSILRYRAPHSIRAWLGTINSGVSKQMFNRDFKVCIDCYQDSSLNSHFKTECTPWASEGGGNLPQIAQYSPYYNTRYYGITLKTRTLKIKNKDVAYNMRLSVQAYNSKYKAWTQWSTPTKWLYDIHNSESASGWTGYIRNSNLHGIDLKMEVANEIEEYCTPQRKCGHGFGDCDDDSDCKPGFLCKQDVGSQYGYNSSQMDVCVDPAKLIGVVCGGATCAPQEVCCQGPSGRYCGMPGDCNLL